MVTEKKRLPLCGFASQKSNVNFRAHHGRIRYRIDGIGLLFQKNAPPEFRWRVPSDTALHN